jgi:hypothetical protein
MPEIRNPQPRETTQPAWKIFTFRGACVNTALTIPFTALHLAQNNELLAATHAGLGVITGIGAVVLGVSMTGRRSPGSPES